MNRAPFDEDSASRVLVAYDCSTYTLYCSAGSVTVATAPAIPL